MILFLLIWGEAANLRFMPELLFFLLEIMRAHCVHQAGGQAGRQAGWRVVRAPMVLENPRAPTRQATWNDGLGRRSTDALPPMAGTTQRCRSA